MARIESRLGELGLVLPPQMTPPKGVVLPFRFVHVVGGRAVVSGHGPQRPDGACQYLDGRVKRGAADLKPHHYRASDCRVLRIPPLNTLESRPFSWRHAP